MNSIISKDQLSLILEQQKDMMRRIEALENREEYDSDVDDQSDSSYQPEEFEEETDVLMIVKNNDKHIKCKKQYAYQALMCHVDDGEMALSEHKKCHKNMGCLLQVTYDCNKYDVWRECIDLIPSIKSTNMIRFNLPESWSEQDLSDCITDVWKRRKDSY